MNKMKVLMILSNPLKVDPRVHNEAKALVDAGNEVTVIVWDRHGDYESESVVDGISVVRIHNKGIMEILPNDLFRNPLWWKKAYKKGLELYKNGFTFDVVHCHDLDTLQAGVWLKKKLSCKVVYDAHENFAYMIAGYVPNFVVRWTLRWEKRLVRHVDHIITVSEPLRDYLQSICDRSITIVMNCKDSIYDNYVPPQKDIFTLIYVGIMLEKRFFPDIIHLVGSLEGVRLIVAGKKEGIFEEVKRSAERYDNVEFVGTISSNEILPRTHAADATFLLTCPPHKKMYHQETLFNKQFEALVCGRPIIVTQGTYAGKMTEELNCGLTVEYNKESVKKAIITLRDNPELCEELGRNAFKAAKERYNWDVEKKKLLSVYEVIT